MSQIIVTITTICYNLDHNRYDDTILLITTFIEITKTIDGIVTYYRGYIFWNRNISLINRQMSTEILTSLDYNKPVMMSMKERRTFIVITAIITCCASSYY